MTGVVTIPPQFALAFISPIVLGDVDPTDVLIGSFFLIMVLVLGFLALMQVKKWMAKEEEPDDG